MSNIKKNLGHVTAYAYYKAGGGTMTEEEFTEYMADFGDAAERAVDAASEAAQSKADAQTAATTATNKADEAAASASSASGSAASAAEDASTASTAANTATGAATTATNAKNDAVSAKNAAQTAQAAAESAAAYSDVRMSVDQFVFHADADGVVQKAQTQKLEIYPYKGNQRLRYATMNGTGLDLSLVDPEHEGASIMLPFWPSTVSTWGQIKVTMSVAVGDQFEANQITKEGTIAITAKDTAGNTYSFSKSFTIVIIRDGADGTVTTEQMDAAIEEAIEPLKEDLSDVNNILNAEYPNLWDCSYSDKSASGIVFKKNNDGTYSVTGTATALFYRQQTVTLPAGVYYVYGFTDGATDTHHILISGLSSNQYQMHGFAKVTLNTETTITLTMRVMNGTSVDTTFKPMIVTEAYNGIDFVPYGGAYFAKTVDEKIDAVEELTGYTKPNLFNNTISSQTANGLTFTVNADKSVTITGTSTALSAPNAKCTLPRGKYLLSGCDDGTSQTYHIMLQRAGGGLIYQYGGTDKAFEVTDDTEMVTLYLRVLSGKTVNTVMRPMIRPASVYNPTYVPYGEYQIYKPIQQLIDYTSFNWSGKKMNVIGDSIVKGDYGNFVNVIRDILCLSEARNYGVGGSCLASSDQDANYTPAVLRYENMDLDAQIIVVHAGTNDYSAQIPLGADDSTDITTFNGALNVMMDGLREMYPTALIIFDSILHRFNDGALTIKASQYRQCIENRCLANHIVFYDAYKYTGFDFAKGYYDHILTGDGLHPNQTGANILGRKLAGFIRWN